MEGNHAKLRQLLRPVNGATLILDKYVYMEHVNKIHATINSEIICNMKILDRKCLLWLTLFRWISNLIAAGCVQRPSLLVFSIMFKLANNIKDYCLKFSHQRIEIAYCLG